MAVRDMNGSHTAGPDERVGVVLVHGIGEQRRFEHIDGQVREIIRALKGGRGNTCEVTVEVASGNSASFHAEQDSWALGNVAPVRALVRDSGSGRLVEISFHEVWWADSNEPYSLAKQIRFWVWGLVIAFIPMKHHSTLAGSSYMRDPVAPGGRTRGERLWVRARLFAVSVVSVLGAASLGLATFVAKRLLNIEPPDFVRAFVNYVAGVKLYNQKSRKGGGIPAENADFLDAMDEPPRVSVRRRMVRALAHAALADYDRWYVVAHSLGTVVAFNGLMESCYAWPGYFDEKGWNELVARGMAGPARSGWVVPTGATSPRRPVWLDDRDVAFRSVVFEKLHGLLTMGTPLEKFATLWPGRVPISCEPAFRAGTVWISVYDPIDPVSGVLRAFDTRSPNQMPQPETLGYAADAKLFISHIRYLKWYPGGGTLVDGVAEWLLTGRRHLIGVGAGPRWFAFSDAPAGTVPTPPPGSARHRSRTRGAWCWWIGAVVFLTMLGGLTLPPMVRLVGATAASVYRHAASSLRPRAAAPDPRSGR